MANEPLTPEKVVEEHMRVSPEVVKSMADEIVALRELTLAQARHITWMAEKLQLLPIIRGS
jgi:hypothetical protein